MRGTKRQRAPGVWEIRVYVGKDPVSGQDKQISRTIHGSARAADAAIRDLIDAQAPGRADGLGVTFAQLLERWLKECDRMELSPTTMRTYRSHVSHVLVPRLGRVPVTRMTAKHLDDLYGALKDSGRSPKTIRNVHATISSALHQAERWGWVRQNIAELAKPPRVAQRRLRPPSVDVVRTIIEAAEQRDPHLAPLLIGCPQHGGLREPGAAPHDQRGQGDRRAEGPRPQDRLQGPTSGAVPLVLGALQGRRLVPRVLGDAGRQGAPKRRGNAPQGLCHADRSLVRRGPHGPRRRELPPQALATLRARHCHFVSQAPRRRRRGVGLAALRVVLRLRRCGPVERHGVTPVAHRTVDRLRRRLGASEGLSWAQFRTVARVHQIRVAETQRRGLVHIHAIVRADGPEGPGSDPPAWLTDELLALELRAAAGTISIIAPDRTKVRWGDQLDVAEIPGVEDAGRAAGYIAKYATKTVDGSFGLVQTFRTRDAILRASTTPHLHRLALAAWDLGGRDELLDLRLREHAHTLGYSGHLITKSRGYSTTFAALRAARALFALRDMPDDVEIPQFAFGYLGRGYGHPEGERMAEFWSEFVAEDRKQRRQQRLVDQEGQKSGLGSPEPEASD